MPQPDVAARARGRIRADPGWDIRVVVGTFRIYFSLGFLTSYLSIRSALHRCCPSPDTFGPPAPPSLVAPTAPMR